jgi:hypothetical protein
MKRVPWTAPVTAEMTAWATSILNDAKTYHMDASVIRNFGDKIAVARIEQHTWTYRGGQRITGNFRGVTLYELIDTNVAKEPL